jgi:protein-export membrane protein SecD
MIGATPILEFKEQDTTPQRELTAEEKKQLDDYNKNASKKMEEALKEAAKTTDFNEFVKKYSEDATSTIAKGGDVGFIDDRVPELYTWAQNHKVGDISKESLKTPDGLNIVKLLAVEEGDEVVSASHILICYKGSEGCTTSTTKEEAYQKITELRKQVTPQNFNEFAKKYSTEPVAKESGGDLPLFRRGAMLQAFDEMAWKIPTSTISEPAETQVGYHLIYKKDQFKMKKYQIARVVVRTLSESDLLPPKEEWKNTQLSGKNLKKAEVVRNPQTGEVQVSLNFDDEGTKLFADITARNTGKPVAIFLDGEVLSAPNVDEPITTGRAVIRSQGFNAVTARKLAQDLNAGALPVPVELLSQEKVDATLGAVSLEKSFKAGIYGLIAIMIFMIIYYRLPGLLSVVSLAFYTILSLAIFKIFGVTMTLSGIAGFILSIGMAVDANILVFERLKEELQVGRSFHASLEESFIRSWPSIRDGHITALISCVFLMWFGSGFIQGFAVILALGTIINLFTAITITRTFMRFCFKRVGEKANILFLGYTKSND